MVGMADDPHEERLALTELMSELGPDAPTLCEGWTTRDLAAHLVVRERRIDALPGAVLPRFAGWTERLRLNAASQEWHTLLNQVRNGSPIWTPLSNPLTDKAFNLIEFFVHHEDVRRAQTGWSPRILPSSLEDELWKRLRATVRFTGRRSPAPLIAVALTSPAPAVTPIPGPDIGPDSVPASESGIRELVVKPAGPGEPTVTVSGQPSELVMFLSGRQQVARVQLDGPAEAVSAITKAHLGM
jgi:uncharacterized protein (TIGR03085 family)